MSSLLFLIITNFFHYLFSFALFRMLYKCNFKIYGLLDLASFTYQKRLLRITQFVLESIICSFLLLSGVHCIDVPKFVYPFTF